MLPAVKDMFNPGLFERGVRLRALELALEKLQGTDRRDLRAWLDVFEDHWILHKERQVFTVSRYMGLLHDKHQQVHESDLEKPPDESSYEAKLLVELLGPQERGEYPRTVRHRNPHVPDKTHEQEVQAPPLGS